MKTLFVANLAPETTEDDIRELFSEYGTVRGLRMSRDIFSGRCRGHALVDMEGHEARAATDGLNGKSYKGNSLRVNEERKWAKGKKGRRR